MDGQINFNFIQKNILQHSKQNHSSPNTDVEVNSKT